MEKTNKIRLIKYIILILIFAIVLAKPIYTVLSNREHLSHKELVDYKNLFDKKAWSDLRLSNTVESELREPESLYIYKDKYNLFVTKVHVPDSLEIDKLLTLKYEASKTIEDEVYFSIQSFNFKIHIKSGELTLVKSINLKVEGKLTTIVFAKDLASFYINFKTSSIVFNNDRSYIVLKTEKAISSAALSFIKKGGLLYVVLLTPAINKAEISPQQINTILVR